MTWENSDYAYAHHLAGSCHTPEEAHRVLTESLNRRCMAVNEYELGMRRRKIDRAKLERRLEACADDLERQEIMLDIEKLSLHSEVVDADYEYALHEIETLRELLARLEPHCMWTDGKMSRQEGYQLAQQEERKLILLERTRLGLLSQGMIDTETLREMRSHPEAAALEAEAVAMVSRVKDGTLRLANRKSVLMLEENNGSK